MKICLLMRSMAVGGTQRQMIVLARELLRRGHEVSALLFYLGEPLDEELRQSGVRLIDLRKQGRWRNLGFLMRLISVLRSERPDVLYAFLPIANVLATLSGPLAGGSAIVCGVRASEARVGAHDRLAALIEWLERRLVLRADVVISNSQAGKRRLCRGRECPNVVVVENGIEYESFRFDAVGRRRLRQAWGNSEQTPVVGCVARLDPIKDHGTLLQAFAQLRAQRPEARLVCVGTFSEPYATQLRALARRLGIDDAVSWFEHETRLCDLYSAVDVLCLSSIHEGFPNVLAEGMACGVPCVATEVGDARRILGEHDFLVPPRDAAQLSQALLAALAQGRKYSTARAEKIRREFTPEALAARTEAALLAAIRHRHPGLADATDR